VCVGLLSLLVAFLLGRIEVPHTNNLPRNAVNFTFAFRNVGSATRDDACAAFRGAMAIFFQATNSLLSSQYQWSAGTFEAVDLQDAPPRIPFHTSVFTGSPSTGVGYDMPPETAIVISYRGAVTSGVNIKRRTGRFYFGPLQMVTMNDQPLVPPGSVSLIQTEFGKVINDPIYDFCVYSRYTHYNVPVGRNIMETDGSGDRVFTEHAEYLPASFNKVTTAWVDNAWDTQRRRGVPASTRTAITPS
jgi:hypothetical protein